MLWLKEIFQKQIISQLNEKRKRDFSQEQHVTDSCCHKKYTVQTLVSNMEGDTVHMPYSSVSQLFTFSEPLTNSVAQEPEGSSPHSQ
jgi:hypothetical protein